jgi:pyruvate dehydrogenase E2 component (dihydrolipoamide acetyltransferase)
MVSYVKLPKLTLTMEEGLIGKWLKKEGEEVGKGEPLCEIETEKTTDVIEAVASGVLRKILIREGTTASVNQIIAIITEYGEEIPNLDELKEKAKEETPRPLKVEKKAIKREKKSVSKRIKISPLARRMADKHGIDISSIKGSGPGRRIVKRDIHKLLTKVEKEKIIPITGMRETIIKRLTLSARTALHVPIVTEVDMTEVVRLRETLVSELKEEESIRPTYTDILVKAVAEALKKHSIVNSRVDEGRIKLLKEINIGIAVAQEEGLIVPVMQNVDKKSIKQIAISRKELVKKARKGELLTREVSGGTFTLSNLGMFDIDIFIPIINPPESAILGVGRILEKPVAINGNISVRPVMTLCLVFDHRVMDGAQASQFMKTLTQIFKNPYLLLA